MAAVVLASWLHRENLVHALFTGRKLGTPQEGIRRAWLGLAALMLMAVLGFWWLQWQDPPQALAGDRPGATAKRGHDRERDHDEREEH